MGQKLPKLVFHVPVTIVRWKSIAKQNLRWSISFWNHYLKVLKFDFPWWRHQPKNGWKRSKLVFYVPMLIERWKSKVKGTFRWNIWNHSLQNLKFWLNVLTSSAQNWLEKKVETGISCTNGDTKIKIKSKNNFQKQSSRGVLRKMRKYAANLQENTNVEVWFQ